MSEEAKKLIRVILADDHQVVRRGIRDFLVESGWIEVVAEAENGDDAVRLIEQHRPDVAVLDVQMPGRNGIDVVRWVREHKLPVGTLILTAYDDDPYLMAALEAGTNGYVMKTAEASEIVKAVIAVNEGRSVLDPGVVHRLMQVVGGGTGHAQITASESGEPVTELTARELAVLLEAARGLTNKAIGLTLGISDRTVQGHLRNIFEKLHVTNRTEAVVKAVQLGMLELPE
jgi:DNA-binding NarL/FixJ family response regulator